MADNSVAGNEGRWRGGGCCCGGGGGGGDKVNLVVINRMFGIHEFGGRYGGGGWCVSLGKASIRRGTKCLGKKLGDKRRCTCMLVKVRRNEWFKV